MIEAATEFLARIDMAEQRLTMVAATDPPPAGLTAPDQPSGERWDWGQVWAHVAEFVPYWVGQVRAIVASDGPGPVAFGRTKADSGRIEAIERDRTMATGELMARVSEHLAELRQLSRALGDDDWTVLARHPTLGEMRVEEIFEEFVVGHLEEHADQLEDLAAEAPGSANT
jgi:hypothetical protein